MTITEFLTARLDEDQARADAMGHFENIEDPYFSCPATRTEPLGDLPFGEEHCDCGLAAGKGRALREVAAKRAILADHQPEYWYSEETVANWRRLGRPEDEIAELRTKASCARCHDESQVTQPDENCSALAYPCPTLRALAVIDSDHPDYDPAWSA